MTTTKPARTAGQEEPPQPDQHHETQRAILELAAAFWRDNHRLYQELQDAGNRNRPLPDPPWIRENPCGTKREANGLSLDPATAAGRIYAQYQKAAGNLNERNREAAALWLADHLIQPAINIGQSAEGEREQEKNPAGGQPVRSAGEIIADGLDLIREELTDALASQNPSRFAKAVIHLQQRTADARNLRSGTADLEELREAAPENGWDQHLGRPGYGESLYEKFQSLRERWSAEHCEDTAKDLIQTMFSRAYRQAEAVEAENPALGNHFLARVDTASSQTYSGLALTGGREAYRRGRRNGLIAEAEMKIWQERGKLPAPRDDGSPWNEYALELLAEARTRQEPALPPAR